MKKLIPPCSYQGGKGKLAKDIVDFIFKNNNIDINTKFYDLCCGSGSISVELINRGIEPKQIVMIDAGEWGLFWKTIGDGSFDLSTFDDYIQSIPKEITSIKNHMELISKEDARIDTIYKFLLLQSASFGSKAVYRSSDNKWKTHGFRNYWLPTETSNRKSPVNPMMPMPTTLQQRVEDIYYYMQGINGIYGNIEDFFKHEDNSIIYIDPPYQGTEGYGFTVNIESIIGQIKNYSSLYNTNVAIYVSEGVPLNSGAILLKDNIAKGGISGKKKNTMSEWLSVF